MKRTGQNTSTAVMQRRLEAPDSLDFFPTPPWAVRALMTHVLADVVGGICWEPACGEGHMARPLTEAFDDVHATDCHDYGFGGVHDFLFPGPTPIAPDWVITNPPFRLAPQFIEKALDVARDGCAMLVRTAFLEGNDRFRTLFQPSPPAIVAPFAERVPMIKGRVDEKASSATAYMWIVWRKGHGATTRVVWIPPCRKALERPDDYRCVARGAEGGRDE